MRALVRLARNGFLGVALTVTTVSVTSIPQPAYAFGFGNLPLVQSITHNTGGLLLTGLGAALCVAGGIAAAVSAPVWLPPLLIGGGVVAAGIGLYKLFSGFLGGFGGGGPSTPSFPKSGGGGSPNLPRAPVPTVGTSGGAQPPMPSTGGNGGSPFPHHGPVAPVVTPTGGSGPVGSQVGRNTPTTATSSATTGIAPTPSNGTSNIGVTR